MPVGYFSSVSSDGSRVGQAVVPLKGQFRTKSSETDEIALPICFLSRKAAKIEQARRHMFQARLDLALDFAQMTGMADQGNPAEINGDRRPSQLQELRADLDRYFRRRVHQREDIPDLVQDVFLRLFRREGSANIENLRGYAYQIAASVLVDRNRRRAIRHQEKHVEFDAQHAGHTEIGPDRILAGREALRALAVLVEDMPERTRTVFVLRRLEHMSYKDIAKRLGISVSAVEKHMLRAMERLTVLGDLP